MCVASPDCFVGASNVYKPLLCFFFADFGVKGPVLWGVLKTKVRFYKIKLKFMKIELGFI